MFTLSWVGEHAPEYAGDSSRMVLWGDSRGATLAMDVVLGLADDPAAPRVKAFVGAEGFYDFSNPFMAANEVTGWYVGEGGDEVRTDKRVSPLPHIRVGLALPNIFLITGTADFAMGPTWSWQGAERIGHPLPVACPRGHAARLHKVPRAGRNARGAPADVRLSLPVGLRWLTTGITCCACATCV